jgi:predicted transcriptional regulator
MNKQKLEPHALCESIPAMSEDEYQVLKADIAENGLRDPIALYQGKILDGRNRYRAMEELGKPIKETMYFEYDPKIDGKSPEAFVLSRNLLRRHLNESQKAALGWETFKRLRRGKGRPKKAQVVENQASEKMVPASEIIPAQELIEQIAADAGSSPKSIREIGRIEEVAPELIEEIKQGASIDSVERKAKAKMQPMVDGWELDKAYDQLKKVLGPEFYNAMMEGKSVKLSAAETVALAQQPTQLMKKFKPCLEAGWNLRRCLSMHDSVVTAESRIQYLLDHAFYAGGKLSIKIDGMKITVQLAAAAKA